MDEKPPETVLEPSPETVRVLEGATQAAQAAKDALLQAQAQHESALEQLQADRGSLGREQFSPNLDARAGHCYICYSTTMRVL